MASKGIIKDIISGAKKIPNWLIFVLIGVLILRIPSFFEPYSYGDEMIYLTLGEGLRQGVPFYNGLHDNKPPMLYIMAAISGSLFWFKVLLAFWNLATIIAFWKLVERLFPKKTKLHKASTVIFAILTTIPLLEGNIANAELFMLLPTILAFYVLFSDKLTKKKLLGAGLLFSFASLFKIPAAFDVPVIFFFWIFTSTLTKKRVKEIVVNTFFIAVGFVIPIAITMVWYWLQGAFGEYLIAAYLQNVGYLSSWRPEEQQVSFFVKNGPLLARGVVVLVGLGVLFWQRSRLPKQFIFVCIWLLFSLFGVTLSERPYPHYLIQAVPTISILFGLLLTDKTIVQSLALIPLSLALFVPVYFNFWRYPTTSYYVKFVNFAVGNITKDEYFLTFSGNTLRDYKIAQLINSVTQKGDKVFVWGSDGKIYALSRRVPPVKYVADYHIRDFWSKEELAKSLTQTLPQAIVLLPEGKSLPQINKLLDENYILLTNIEGANVWVLVKPEVKSLIKY